MQFNKKTRKKKYITLALGFTIQTDISNYVNIQYQHKGNAEIDLKEFFGAENYKIIERLCKENMKELGY